MTVEEITDFAAFLELESEWEDLRRESPARSFFLSHAWFRCCWPEDGSGLHPLVLRVRDGTTVVGLVPLVIQKSKWRIFPARVMSVMHNQDSPFVDLVFRDEARERVLEAVLRHLGSRGGWDLLSLPKIGHASPTYPLLCERLHDAAHLQRLAARSPVLVLDGGWKKFWDSQSQRFKKTVRNVANRIERLGTITVEEVGEGTDPQECLETFTGVAAKSWKAQLPISVTRNPRIARFLERLTYALCATGRLSLWVLRVNGTAIATEYHVRDGETVYALRSDFDEGYREASPGAYLNQHIVRTYFERDLRTYDMGPGDSAYKQRWATMSRDLDTFWIFNRGMWASTLFQLEQRGIPYARHAREWVAGFRTSVPPKEHVGA